MAKKSSCCKGFRMSAPHSEYCWTFNESRDSAKLAAETVMAQAIASKEREILRKREVK